MTVVVVADARMNAIRVALITILLPVTVEEAVGVVAVEEAVIVIMKNTALAMTQYLGPFQLSLFL